jgi:hypothetical protein
MALPRLAPQLLKTAKLLGRFDTLGHSGQTQLTTQRNNGANNLVIAAIGLHLADKRAVNFGSALMYGKEENQAMTSR